MTFTVLIPARYQASRLPAKPLRLIQGVPLVVRVLEQARASSASRIVVATDAEEVASVVREHEGEVLLTDPNCASGTDRIAQATRALGLEEEELVVNCQGDEPFLPPNLLDEVAAALLQDPRRLMATAAHLATEGAPVGDPHVVKVVSNYQGDALYFSRATIPWHGEDRKDSATGLKRETGPSEPPVSFHLHIGVYAYRVGFLRTFTKWSLSPLEQKEGLEQLRALENGVPIRVIETSDRLGLGVDTPEDLERANQLWAERNPASDRFV